jgi:hypothetical protein
VDLTETNPSTCSYAPLGQPHTNRLHFLVEWVDAPRRAIPLHTDLADVEAKAVTCDMTSDNVRI